MFASIVLFIRLWPPNDPNLMITAAGVCVALFIGGMQVFVARQQKDIAKQQKDIAERQVSTSSLQGGIQAVSSWLPFLQDKDPTVRQMTVTQLERIGTEVVLAPLVIALSDSEEAIRKEAARALGSLAKSEAVNTMRVINIVVRILVAQNEVTRKAATDTLEEMGFGLLRQINEALEKAGPQVEAIGQEAVARIILNEYALEKIGALASHELTLGSPDIIVALIGTGVDQSIPDIKNSLIEEQNFTESSGTPYRLTSLVARLIVGRPNSDIVGIAPGVKLISERVFDERGAGTIAQIFEGLYHVLKTNADIVYISVDMSGTEYTKPFAQVIDELTSTGRLVIAPAGNEGSDTKVFPAALDNVLAVVATDENDKKAHFSNYGDWVDISAPGTPMVSETSSQNMGGGGSLVLLSLGPSLRVLRPLFGQSIRL
jgi:subtilisin family serine protease